MLVEPTALSLRCATYVRRAGSVLENKHKYSYQKYCENKRQSKLVPRAKVAPKSPKVHKSKSSAGGM